MQRMTQRRDARAAGLTLAAVSVSGLAFGLGVGLVSIAGCASGAGSGADRGAGKISLSSADDQSGYVRGFEGLAVSSKLERLIEREAGTPSAGSFELANRIMDGRLEGLEPGTDAYAHAVRSLDAVLESAVEPLAIVTDGGGIGDEGFEVAMLPQIAKGYVRARSAMLNDDAEGAVAIFEQLAVASPQSTEILIGLGDAYMRLGDRGQAVDAYLRAVELGDRTNRALVYGAMGSTHDPERVIELGAMAWGEGESTIGADRAGALLGGVMLGRALIEDGQLAAGAEVMTRAMGMLDGDTARDPRFRRELIQLYTQRAEQFASLGDAWMMLDQPERALEVYELARGIAGDEPIELMARRVAAELLAGNSGLAAQGLMGWIGSHPGEDSALLHHLVGIVGEHVLIGGIVRESLGERMGDASLQVSQRRALLGLVLTLEGDRDASVEILSNVDASIVSPVACARVLGMFDAGEERLDAVMRIVERNPAAGPMVVPAMIRLDGRAIDALEMVDGESGTAGSETAELVRCLIAVDLQRPDLLGSLETIDGSYFDARSTTWLIAHARAAVLGARWSFAALAFDACAGRAMNGAEHSFYVDTLMVGNRMKDAIDSAEARAQSEGGNAADWLSVARMHQILGDRSGLVGALEMALELDPYDEGVYEQLITVLGAGGEAGDVEQLREVTRSLGQRLPRSAMVSLIRAHEMASAGAQGGEMLAQSERLLMQAHAEHRYREIGVDLLLSVWRTQMTQGDEGAVARGLAWIDSQREDMAGSVDLASARARMMVLMGDNAGAESFLEGFYEQIPSRRVGRLHEGLIRSDESRREEADRLALARLAGLVSVEDCLERLERAGGIGALGEFGLEELVPVEGEWVYSLGQSLRIVRVLGAVAQSGLEGTDAELLLKLIERTRAKSLSWTDSKGINPLSALELIELVMLPASERFEMDAYEQLVRSLDGTAGGRDPYTAAIQSLLRSRGESAGLEMVTRLSIDDDGMIDEGRIRDLPTLIGQLGSAEDLRFAIDWMDRAGLMVEARDAVVASLGVLQEGSLADKTDLDGVKADFAYTAAVVASFYEREDESDSMYNVALGFDAGHAWANNDLGYRMIEDGGDLEVAERHLIVAHEAEPKAASITDSLAWVRYAMGIFRDEVDGDGAVVRRGAIGLLEEALELEGGEENATIDDHLGDALWMVGEFERAIGAWLDAEDKLRSRLTELSNEENLNTRAIESIREELSSIRYKISDGESGRVPGVAENRAGASVPNPAGSGDIVEEVVPEK